MGETHESKSTLVSRNLTVLGRRTSVRLEPEMWTALKEITQKESCKVHDVCSLIQLRKNPNTSLTAAIRVFIMLYFRAAATKEGHDKAGHGGFDNMLARARISLDMFHASKTGDFELSDSGTDEGEGRVDVEYLPECPPNVFRKAPQHAQQQSQRSAVALTRSL